MVRQLLNQLYCHRLKTPLGNMIGLADSKDLYLLLFENQSDVSQRIEKLLKQLGKDICQESNSVLVQTQEELTDYFNGKRQEFTLSLGNIGTPFQERVWRILATIPYGEVRTYKEVAECLGDVKKARAVGRANALNPILVVRPCHRVVASSGTLSGYAGGEILKEKLLELEKNHTKYLHSLKI